MWEHILGHESQKAFLQSYLRAEERPHALLFCGASGLGKRQLALAFAKSLLCENNSGEDACESCRLMNIAQQDFSHPDFLLVKREFNPDKNRYEDITVDQVRDLISKTAFAPIMGRTKVCIIDDADCMRAEAANSMLKLVEEPPEGWVLLLIATSVSRLLPTILSRVVQLRFAPVPLPLVEQKLMEQGLAQAQAAVLARLSEGSIGQALKLQNGDALNGVNNDVFAYRTQAWAFLEALPLAMPLNYLAGREWQGAKFQRGEAQLLVQLWQLLIRDLMLCKLQLYDRIYNIDLTDELRAQSRAWQVAGLKKALAAVSEAHLALGQFVSVKVALEVLALKIDQAYKE